MKTKFRKGMVVITMPRISPVRPSKSGKSLVVATSVGPRRTGLRVNGKQVIVTASAWIHPDEPVKLAERKDKATPRKRVIGRNARKFPAKRRNRRAI
jgi:hypothetical protein